MDCLSNSCHSVESGSHKERQKSTRILFLVDDVTHHGGVRTRVAEEIGCLRDEPDIEPIVVSRCYARNISMVSEAVDNLSRDMRIPNLRGFAYPKVPHGGVRFACEFSFIINTILSLILLVPFAIRHRIDFVYGHNNECGLSAILISRILRVANIIDLHGVEVDEYLEVHPGWNPDGSRLRLWRRVEKFILTKADTLVCVSNAHRDVVVNWAETVSSPVVIPCFADEEAFFFSDTMRDKIRSRLDIRDNDVLFVYSGLISPRYGDFNPIRFFLSLENIANKKLLILTGVKSIEIADRQIPSQSRECIRVLSVDRSEVPGYLSASDIAILIRNESIVNRVASPTKFSEYLLCGLPVVMSCGLGDATSLVQSEMIGVCTPHPWSGDEIVLTAEIITGLLSSEIRSKARQVGVANLSRKVYRSAFVNLLKSSARAEVD